MNRIETRERIGRGVATVGAVMLLASAAAADRLSIGTTFPRLAGSVSEFDRAYLLLGAGVYDAQSHLLGRIEQVALNRGLDGIDYVVLSLDEKTKTAVVLPFSAIRRNSDRLLKADVSETNIWRAPRFNGEKLSEMTDKTFALRVDEFYKKHSPRYVREAAKVAPTGSSERAEDDALVSNDSPYLGVNRLLNLGVRVDEDGLGVLRGIVFDLHDGEILYGMVSAPRQLPKEMVVVPWNALDMEPRRGVALLYAERGALGLLAFSGTRLPNLNDHAVTSRLFRTLGREQPGQVYGYAPRTFDPNRAWRAGSDFNRKFDGARLTSFAGSVQNVLTFVPGPEAVSGVRLRVRTPQGDTVTVLGGPKAYWERAGIGIKDGDSITVRGSDATVDGRPVVLASEILVGDVVHRIRAQDGEPLWRSGDLKI